MVKMTETEIMTKLKKLRLKLNQVKGTETEVYSRIVGYYRSVKLWNTGKQSEYNMRKEYKDY
jgi:anaerobic ribonucleoside-triphosphate reductase